MVIGCPTVNSVGFSREKGKKDHCSFRATISLFIFVTETLACLNSQIHLRVSFGQTFGRYPYRLNKFNLISYTANFPRVPGKYRSRLRLTIYANFVLATF